MLELKGITKIYNPGTVNEMCLFDRFSLSIQDGQFVSVVGSNGSGKTSLLNILCGSIPIEEGQIFIGGEDISHQKEFVRNRRIGRVYQNPSMGTCASMTILENMAMADRKGRRYGLGRGTDKRRIAFYRDQLHQLGLGLEDKLDMKAGVLSGGQRQAMALLMSTLTPIEFLILDEHTAALDPKTAETIMELTDRVVREKGMTTIMVTHNLRYAVEYGDRLIMMHQGGVVMDKADEAKRAVATEDILRKFTEISVECGN
jgi:putative ABC transport system ATP-binding protein